MANEKQGNLKRVLTPIDVWGLALGAIIGWGCFVLPGDFFLPTAGPLGTAIGMLIGAAIVIVIAFSYNYLIKVYPQSGGEYIYTEKMLGKNHAYACGWAMILIYWALIPLNGMALALVARYLFPGVIQVGYLYTLAGWDIYLGEVALASGFLILMALANIFGVKNAARVQTFIALLLAGSVIVLGIIAFGKTPDLTITEPMFSSKNGIWAGIFSIVATAPWAFLGFDCIPQSAEEFKFSPKRTIHIMLLAIFIAAIIYVMVTFITCMYQPWEGVIADKNITWATGHAVKGLTGTWGLGLLGMAMFCAVVSGMNAFYLSVSRLMMSMAQRGDLPAKIGRIHPKTSTPHVAIIIAMVMAIIMPWFGRGVLVWITELTSMGAAIVFLYTTIAAAKMAKQNNHKQQLITGIIGALLSALFLGLLIYKNLSGALPWQSLVGLIIWIVLGFVMYFVTRRNRK